MSFRQCPKRLWLQVHRPELAEVDPHTEAIFAIGHQVGDIARRVYDDGTGIMVECDAGMPAALSRTLEVLEKTATAPVFEATVEREGLLVRADVLLRDNRGPRLIEVKASTKPTLEHLEDCAIQSWVFESSPARPRCVALAHVNNQFIYQGDGRYAGFLVERDVTGDLVPLREKVPEYLQQAKETIESDEPDIAIGTRCNKPYACPFQTHCWRKTDLPLRGLPGVNSRLDVLLADGHYDVRELPESLLWMEGQYRVWRAIQNGRAQLLPGAARLMAALDYPRYYLDFETIGFAVPRWIGTRPYQTVPFQWSLHIEDRKGALRHEEFLELSGDLPARAVAHALLLATREPGPILMYTTFERQCIESLAALCPELRDDLMTVAERLVDLHPIVKAHYYHPDMHGSWSIKAVLPTIAPELDYSRLGAVQEGIAAQSAYTEAVSPTTAETRRSEIRAALLRYCKHDTFAMVTIAQFLSTS